MSLCKRLVLIKDFVFDLTGQRVLTTQFTFIIWIRLENFVSICFQIVFNQLCVNQYSNDWSEVIDQKKNSKPLPLVLSKICFSFCLGGPLDIWFKVPDKHNKNTGVHHFERNWRCPWKPFSFEVQESSKKEN